MRQKRQQTGRKRLWTKRQIWNGVWLLLTFAPCHAVRQNRQQTISRNSRKQPKTKRQLERRLVFFLFPLIIVHFARTGRRSADQQYNFVDQHRNLERIQVSIYLGSPSCISPEQTADKQERQEKAMGQKESGMETGFYSPWRPVVHFARTGSR